MVNSKLEGFKFAHDVIIDSDLFRVIIALDDLDLIMDHLHFYFPLV